MGYLFYFFGAASLILLSSLSVAEEKVYYWVDAEGRAHYSSELPEGVAGQEVNLNSQPVTVEAPEEVYRWKDSDGNVHYGDKPPQGSAAAKMNVESNSMSTIGATKVRPGERKLLDELIELQQ